MKKIFTMALMSLVFMACNKEEIQETPKEEINTKEEIQETPKEETHPIEGTWDVESYSEVQNGETKTYPVDSCDEKATFIFSKGTMKIINYAPKDNECIADEGSTFTYTYTISGNTITAKNEKEEESSTFSISGKTLTLTSPKNNTTILKKR